MNVAFDNKPLTASKMVMVPTGTSSSAKKQHKENVIVITFRKPLKVVSVSPLNIGRRTAAILTDKDEMAYTSSKLIPSRRQSTSSSTLT